MATIKTYLDTRRPKDDGTCPLKLNINIEKRGKILISTKLWLNSENWENGTIVGRKDKETVLSRLRLYLNRIDDELLRMERTNEINSLSLSDIKKRLDAVRVGASVEVEETHDYLVKDHFEYFVRFKERTNTKEVYYQTLKKITQVADIETFSFTQITVSWLREFEQSMKQAGLSINSINIHMRNLRAVVNDAINEDKISQALYPFRKFKLKTEKTVRRALSVEQLQMLRDYPCEPHQERYRDIFMLIFYLIGINIGDLLNLKEIKDGRIEFRRAKTGRLYSIKVPPEAMLIIEKYRGEKYLLNILDVYGDADNFLSRINKNLKQIGTVKRVGLGGRKEREPILPMLSTYWARHTWATIAASLDIPKETIAAALGHGGNTVTDIYIDFDQRKVDAANRAVIDHLNAHNGPAVD